MCIRDSLKITQDLLNEQQIEYNNQFVRKTVQVLIDGAGNRSGQIKEVLTHSLLGEKI